MNFRPSRSRGASAAWAATLAITLFAVVAGPQIGRAGVPSTSTSTAAVAL